jgi:hypothetical protein
MCTSESHRKGQIQRGAGVLHPQSTSNNFYMVEEEEEDNRERDRKRLEIDPKIEERK